MIEKTKKIWLDGKLVDWGKANVHVLVNALHYGTGVFEGIRCYQTDKGGAVFRLAEHIDRLFYSAKCLGIEIPLTREQLKKAILLTVRSNGLEECYIRPLVFCGYGNVGLDIDGSSINTTIIAWPWKMISMSHNGISASISSYTRLSPKSVPIDAKISGYYVNSIIASSEARKKGAKEAILLDSDGYVAEGSGENIFVVSNKKVYTPSLGAILPGITRDSVIKIAKNMGINVIEKKISVNELKKCHEAFFTGTAVEICPIAKINGNKIGDGGSGEISTKIKEEYDKIVRGQNDKYKNWLTLV